MTDIIQSDQWETPDDLFAVLNEEFKFDMDLCAAYHNKKLDTYSNEIDVSVQDLLTFPDEKFKSFWMNPPYSRGNIEFCMDWATQLLTLPHFSWLVTLTRFDPTTDWFQTYVDGVALEVRMLARRVKFKGASSCYNFPCCVAVYDGPYKGAYRPTDYYIWDWQ